MLWLTCFVVPPTPEAWVAAVSSPADRGTATISGVTVELLLDACRNMVIWDRQVNIVQFAQLSVRESLKKNESTSSNLANLMVVESCLIFLENSAHWLSRPGILSCLPPAGFHTYLMQYWPCHAMACLKDQMSAILTHLRSFLESKSYMKWAKTLEDFLYDHGPSKVTSLEWILSHLRSNLPNPLLPIACLGLVGY